MSGLAARFGHLSPGCCHCSGASSFFSHLDYYNSPLMGVLGSASAPTADFTTCQVVVCFAQNLPVAPRVTPSQIQVLRVVCEAPAVPPDPSAPLPVPLHGSCAGLLPFSRRSRLLGPLLGAPRTLQAPSSSSLGLCSNVTFSVRTSRTTCFLSSGSSLLSTALRLTLYVSFYVYLPQ